MVLLLCAAAVKQAVGGETASQANTIEQTIKRWFRSQEDMIKAEAREKLRKKQMEKELSKQLSKALKETTTATDGQGDAQPEEPPVLQLSVPEAMSLGGASNN